MYVYVTECVGVLRMQSLGVRVARMYKPKKCCGVCRATMFSSENVSLPNFIYIVDYSTLFCSQWSHI